MEAETAQVDNLSIAIEEMRRVAQLEGVMNLLIMATEHRSGNLEHRFVSVGSIEGCNSCTMEALGRFIGMEMDEMVIADHLDAIQSAYAKRTSTPPVGQVRERWWPLEEQANDTGAEHAWPIAELRKLTSFNMRKHLSFATSRALEQTVSN